ncbi:fibrinogen-like YCDxxxxGGGW domain-containing protein [Nannocystis sp. SCPEA4]|uniref:fibrinogen-like YCDxxxxGGGW domain-containing protein n=1 Tax=Nannocystis sp. SCPEA4 TaxID=2996787 RepID=UPI00226EEC0B|nr:fibrinogen-like YCDxxxxGGGW domain-containing protein [Nannocystis sp. SCPEA4]MCY1053589.1 fibrinogen-like YCDxxxxGGGW domain-containing protein [Nannocystis sp. SCPEA4]
MRTGLGRVAVFAVSAAVMTTACLEDNPWFEEPTGSGSGGLTTMIGATTTVTPPATTTSGSTTDEDDSEDDSETTDTTGSLTTMTSMTGVMSVCGDGIPEGGEECDEGADNADDGACTTACKLPTCGDGLLQAGEVCDDGNPASDDGCVACQVPRTCAEIHMLDGNAPSGAYVLDLDGPDPVAVYCDMNTTGGGWTVIERSALADPIGVALFKDYPVNLEQPGEAPFRLGRAAMELVLANTTELRIDCGGADYLLTSSLALFEGEQGGATCENAAAIMYKEASLKGYMKTDVLLCTGFLGAEDGCEGAWYIDEGAQYLCQSEPFPWEFMIPVTSQSADTFAVDAAMKDTQDPVHDCHQDGAVRVVMLR